MGRLRQFHVLCCVGYTFLCLAWRAAAGRTFTWDHLQYHLYGAHAWWTNRLPEELFAAGPQSYLNPLPHLPFYAVYQTGAPSLVIALSMALLHSINLWLLHFIACRLIPPTDRMRRLAVVCGVLLGGLSPAFLYEVGTSYADVIVSIPALAALLVLLTWKARPLAMPPDWRPLYAAGLLAGIAMGLKPTSFVFCASLAAALVMLSGRQAWGVAWRATLSSIAGLAMVGGSHAWMLWKAFGNPVFPLFNGFFRSPWFPPVNVVSARFRPASLEAALRFPLDMANSFKRVSFEEQVVDIRPLWLLGLVACVTLIVAIRHIRSSQSHTSAHNDKILFWLAFALFTPAWIYSSGNIRYAIEALLLLGPAISLLALFLVGKRHIVALLAILLPVMMQAVLATTVNALILPGFKWEAWRSEWVSTSLPDPLNRIPAYYLSLQSLGFASFAPVFPSESRFFNLIGSSAFPPDALPLKVMGAYHQSTGLPLRTLYQDVMANNEKTISQRQIDTQNSLLSEYGYKILEDGCVEFLWNNTNNPSSSKEGASTRELHSNDLLRMVLISCPVVRADPLSRVEQLRRRNVDARIDRWVRKCPEVFSPAGLWSQQYPKIRRKFFPNNDVDVYEPETGELLVRYWDTNQPLVYLEDKAGTQLISGCPKKLLE